MNPTNLPVFLKTNHRIAKANLVDTASIYDFNTETEADMFNLSSKQNMQSPDCEKILKEIGINLNCEHITEDQKQKLTHFLCRNKDTFAKDISEIGETNLHTHTIHTGQAKHQSAPLHTDKHLR